MKINWDNPTEEARIEVIPLIDVIFCILTFFILAAVGLTRQQAITVDLPSAKTGTTQMQDMLIVSVDTVGQTYIEQELVPRDQLRQRLLAYQIQNAQGLMVLYASKTALYEDVVQILDLMRSVGGDRVALATLPTGVNPSEVTPAEPPNLDLGIPGLTPLPTPVPAPEPTTTVPEAPEAPETSETQE
ncbi:MAG: biopolymer transporter ExbD [Roseofilum sp. SBFL]|uniref:ExbD/TolR family protein n=1 Tax=unclassified Roseofilum TaxID=2620099 RepID=UPI001B18F794|nr:MULTISPECIES: biopolymer transporter ExbD [unclassified Roseofilum]MBP0013405.1 biopolymer transporter ExbD [Roseofilum sp. SID3]MBP0022865.1 biopolymer transporter ExbD [Roseofilum sp. SID2]MBP0036344.1 biopolymer transporter ExbD [Roseofilum sp. SID1]MBP0043214.1 biopolymer transporter ExbD [Roseofilum sp. SBFL]